MAGTPTRSAAPVTEPAEVPTMTVACRGSQAGLALQGREDPGLVGLADDAAGTEHQADRRSLPAPESPTDHLHHPPFYPAVQLFPAARGLRT